MKLPKKVTILDVATLASHIQHTVPSRIDASAVEHIDTSILQLLCALIKTSPTTIIEAPSVAFLEAAQRCGLQHHLQEAA